MGAWSEYTFGNDAACDWAGRFIDDPGLAIVRTAIDKVRRSFDEVASHDACECLAACEVIARLRGEWGLRNSYSERLDQWIEAHPTDVPEELTIAAIAAIDQILSPHSQLRHEWDDGFGEPDEDWQREVTRLRSRIVGNTE